MGYRKYNIPVAHGKLVEDGDAYLGVEIIENKGNYVLYDLESQAVKHRFGQSLVDYEDALEVEDLQLPQGVSANGAYFFTDYEYEYRESECECAVVGCSVEVFDLASGEKTDHIQISGMYEDWEDECLLLEAAKLDNDQYLFAYYDHEEDGWDSFEVCVYDGHTKKIDVVDSLDEEDGFFVDMHFDRDALQLNLRYVDSEALNLRGRDVWQNRTYQISSDMKALKDVSSHDDCFLVPFDDEDTGKKIWRRIYEAGFEVETAKKGLFGKEDVTFYDHASGKVLKSFEINKNTEYWFEFLDQKGVLVIGFNDFKEETQSAWIFEKDFSRYELAEELELPFEAWYEYDEQHQALLLQTDKNTVVIK